MHGLHVLSVSSTDVVRPEPPAGQNTSSNVFSGAAQQQTHLMVTRTPSHSGLFKKRERGDRQHTKTAVRCWCAFSIFPELLKCFERKFVRYRRRPERQPVMDASKHNMLVQSMSVLSRTRHLDLHVTMPSYEGHIGDDPRPMTKAEKSMVKEFPCHNLLGGCDDTPTTPTGPAARCRRTVRPWIPT